MIIEEKIKSLLNLLPYERRRAITRIINRNGVKRIHQFLFKVNSSTDLNKSYNVSYYQNKKRFLCNCEGYVKTIDKIGKALENRKIDLKEKQFLEQNFKCIHIYSVYIYLIKNG